MNIAATVKSFASTETILGFGAFRLLLTQRILLEDGRPVRLGSRALEILFELVEHAGKIVPKCQLMERVWPGVCVEEGTLRVHISALRRVLGDSHSGLRFVENVTGLGYRFVAPVTIIDGLDGAAVAAAPEQTASPAELIRMVGRVQTVGKILAQVRERRLVTIVGAGGIGKTTVALSAANRLRSTFADGVHFVNLAGITLSGQVASALASVFRQPVLSDDPLPVLAEYLREKHLLIVLDNCEHVIDAAAVAAEYLLKCCPKNHILATSREPLHAASESVQRLAPLRLPDRNDLTASEALRFPAIQLFVERAAEASGSFQLRDGEVSRVVAICRKLDGLPLAIELAAACVERFGLRGLAARLDDRLQVLKNGRRTALAKHKTLRATLDWSYDMLAPAEQRVLRQMSVFAGRFDARSAARVGESRQCSSRQVADTLADLTNKSLLVADFAGDEVLYRLLNTTRAYALEKLEEHGEAAAARRRHAEIFHEWGWFETAEQCYVPAPWIDDVRGALDWCFSASGDPNLGVKLILSSAKLWFRLEFLDEYGHRVCRGLQFLEAASDRDRRAEMQLNLLLGEIILYARGSEPAVAPALDKAYELASALHDRDTARECLWAMYCERIRAGDYPAALVRAEQWRDTPEEATPVKSSRRQHKLSGKSGDVMFLLAHHLLGNHSQSRAVAHEILARESGTAPPVLYDAFHYDDRASAFAVLARVLWIQGFPEQAVTAGREGVERAVAINHGLSICFALLSSAAVHMWTGSIAEAHRLATQLNERATRHSLGYWQQWARCIEWGIEATQGQISDPFAQNHPLQSLGHQLILATFNSAIASDALFLRVDNPAADWCTPELLRVKAVSLMRSGKLAPSAAEKILQDSRELASKQGALSWELRTSSSLAQLWADGGRAADARELLQSVCARFTEGHASADMVAAQTLLKVLWRIRAVGRRA